MSRSSFLNVSLLPFFSHSFANMSFFIIFFYFFSLFPLFLFSFLVFLSFFPTNSWLCYAESWSFGKWKRQPATNILSFFLSWKHKHRRIRTHALSLTHALTSPNTQIQARAHTHTVYTLHSSPLELGSLVCVKEREKVRGCV